MEFIGEGESQPADFILEGDLVQGTLPQPCWMLISAHWAEISIQQGAGQYCLIAIRMYDCE